VIIRILALALVSSLALAQETMRVEPGRVAADRAPARASTQVTHEEISADLARMQAGLAQAGSALVQGAAMYQQYDQQLDSYLQLAADAARGDGDCPLFHLFRAAI
jgi:hypothetical protein